MNVNNLLLSEIRQFGIRLQFKLSWVFHMHRQRIRLVVEEAIRSKCRADVHDEVVYRTMTWMHKISLGFKQLVNALDDISFPEHNLFFNRYEFVLHVRLESMYEMFLRRFPLLCWDGKRRLFFNSSFKFLSNSSIIQKISVILSLVIIAFCFVTCSFTAIKIQIISEITNFYGLFLSRTGVFIRTVRGKLRQMKK